VSDPENPDKTLRYRRPSGYAKNLDDENALVDWRIWKAMQGVAHSRALAAEVNSTREDDRPAKKVLREKAMDKGAANESADMGTALHAMTVRVEDGDDDFEIPDQYADDLLEFVSTLGAYGLVSSYSEIHMVNDPFRAAGTADRIFTTRYRLIPPDGVPIEPGELVLGDIKTGKSLDFSAPGFCVQTAIYATGVFYDIVTERRMPTPAINNRWTILIHLPVGKASCTLHWCSIEVGLHGAWLAHEVKEWQRLWKNGTHDTPKVEQPLLIEQVIEAELGPTTVVVDEATTPRMMSYCRARIGQIRDNASARAALLRLWPTDLPKPADISTSSEVARLLALLDAVEAQFSLPFVRDPRIDETVGQHKDKA
jgi:hypothetical protein